jgi:opacity protein-like surface antigen
MRFAPALLFSLLLAVPSLPAQGFGIGIKAGVPFNDVFNNLSYSGGRIENASGRYTFGPMFELRLPARLGIELDVLYRSARYRDIPSTGNTAEANGQSWVFPLTLKYRFRGGLVTPYAEGGIAMRRLTGLGSVRDAVSGRSDSGLVLGIGLEGRALIRVSPQIRYTRWTVENFGGTNQPFTNRDQIEALIGVSF